MAALARILTVGTLIATVSYAGAATSQTVLPTDVDNQQVQLGDVFATQTLNVVEQTGDTAAVTTATGNSFSTAADGVSRAPEPPR